MDPEGEIHGNLGDLEENAMLIKVGVYIRGKLLDLDGLTKALHVEPTRTNRMGERRSNNPRISSVFKSNTWIYSLESNVTSPQELAMQALSAFHKVDKDLSSFPGVEAAFLDVFYSRTPESGSLGEFIEFSLDTETVHIASRLGLPIQFSVGNTLS